MNKNQKGFGVIELLIILVILGLIGAGGWYVYHKNQKSKKPVTTSQTAKKKAPANKPAAAATVAPISDSLKENIAASIESQNTAALEGYMTDSVTVVIAASEKGGAVSATQAVADLDYLQNGTSPWNFALAADTLTTYKNGSYGQYFGDRTVVGQSTNNYVVSFHVNDSGKIDTVFMTVSADLLV
jgi:cytoskeletal protein RodZ